MNPTQPSISNILLNGFFSVKLFGHYFILVFKDTYKEATEALSVRVIAISTTVTRVIIILWER
jgi:hypothetical protein